MPKGGCKSCGAKDPETIRYVMSQTVSHLAAASFGAQATYFSVFPGCRRLVDPVFTGDKPFAGWCGWGMMFNAHFPEQDSAQAPPHGTTQATTERR